MNRITAFSFACAVTLCWPGAAGAADEAPRGATMVLSDDYRQTMQAKILDDGRASFEKLDKNRDGKVTAKEFGKKRAEAFRELDGNGDGKLTREEHRTATLRRDLLADIVLAYMLRWDADRDGLLAKHEFRGRPAAFVDADQDENNVLHHGELMNLMRSGKPVQYSPTRFVKSHDLDGDGRIDRAEWKKTQSSDSLFKIIDANGDAILAGGEVERFLMRYERRLAPLRPKRNGLPMAPRIRPRGDPEAKAFRSY